MNNTNIETQTYYQINACDNPPCDYGYGGYYNEDFKQYSENEYEKALKKFNEYESLFDNVSLTKHIDITETIKEKTMEHICTFEETGYALYGIDEYGRYVQPELKCECGKKEYKEKEYLDNDKCI